MADQQNYLTETHRIEDKISKTRLLELLSLLGASAVLSIFALNYVHNKFITKKDREKLALIKKYEKETQIAINKEIQANRTAHKQVYNVAKLVDYEAYLKKQRREILNKYPSAYLTFNAFKGKTRLYYILGFLALLVGDAAGFIYLRKRLNKDAVEFFYRVPKAEDPYGLKPEITIRAFVDHLPNSKEFTKQMFSDIDTYLRISEKVSSGLDEKKAKKHIEKALNDINRFCNIYYPIVTPEDYFRIEVILWHYVFNLYGNAPTGLVSKFIKDYTIRKMLSLYIRRNLPVMFDVVNGEFIEKDYKTYILLKIIYDADTKYGILQNLRKALDPLPFEM